MGSKLRTRRLPRVARAGKPQPAGRASSLASGQGRRRGKPRRFPAHARRFRIDEHALGNSFGVQPSLRTSLKSLAWSEDFPQKPASILVPASLAPFSMSASCGGGLLSNMQFTL
jgi:hypothetical protein